MSITFLSSSNWISPQIDLLLYLQNIRMFLGGKLDGIFLFITMFGEYFFPVIIASVIYWCFDIKKGIYLFSLFALNIYVVQLFKMVACVYRPWVLNSSVHPSPKAFLHAGGYSFPSGHSSMSSTFWGGIAFLVRKKPVFSALCILLILSVGFSRLFLGVHTPQDVLTGFSIGLFLVFLVYPLIDWMEQDRKRYLFILYILNVILGVILYYILTKYYPIDYLNHEILVQPQKAIYNSLISFGLSAGVLNGLFLFRRFFDIDINNCSLKIKITRAVLGLVLISFLMIFLVDKSFGDFSGFAKTFFKQFFAGFFITFIYPLSFKFIK